MSIWTEQTDDLLYIRHRQGFYDFHNRGVEKSKNLGEKNHRIIVLWGALN